MTEVLYYPLAEAHFARGAVVVIDVLRAFTTAAFAFHSGAKEIYPAASVEDTMGLKARIPGALVMDEVDGYKPEGFDFSNSPADIQQADLHNRSLVQHTSAGTQGIIRESMNLISSSKSIKAMTLLLLGKEPLSRAYSEWISIV